MKNLPLYNDSDIGYLDEEFLELEVVKIQNSKLIDKNNVSEELPNINEEESKKI